MTTTKQAQPTPYDAEIAMLLRVPPYEMTREDREHLRRLREKQEIDDRAYCRAKAEDADLLALAEQMVAYEDKRTENVSALDVLEAWGTFIDQARAAIARAGGGTPLALVADALDKAEYRLLECSITYQVPGVHSQVGRPARP